MLTLFKAVFAPPRDLMLLLVAGWIGLALSDRRARASSVGEKALDTLVLSSLAAFVLGGRLLFVAAHTAAFAASPLGALSLNTSAFDTAGGTASAVIVAAIVMQRKHMQAWQALDLLAPLLAMLAVGLSLSHLASGAAFGKEAQLPWSIQLWGAQRHPTQVYELIAAVLTLTVLMLLKPREKAGELFLLWLAMAAASRLVIEGFRGDSTLVLGGLRLAQIAAWLLLAGSLMALELLHRQRPTSPAQEASAVSAAHAEAERAQAAQAGSAAPPSRKRKRTAEDKGGA